jgi:hypothetical protein
MPKKTTQYSVYKVTVPISNVSVLTTHLLYTTAKTLDCLKSDSVMETPYKITVSIHNSQNIGILLKKLTQLRTLRLQGNGVYPQQPKH